MTDAKNVPLSGAEVDTLVALVERGPVETANLPSAPGASALLVRGHAVETVIEGEEGYFVATLQGVQAYKRHFSTSMHGYGGPVSIAEVKANRIAKADIHRAIYGKPKKEGE